MKIGSSGKSAQFMLKTLSNSRVLLIASVASLIYFARPVQAYTPTKELCDGLPKLPVESMQGTCLSLIAQKSPDSNFVKPRKAVEVRPGFSLLVTDMGGWIDKRGVLWQVQFMGGSPFSGPVKVSKVLTGLSLPHGIRIGPDGFIYLGEAHQITRFRFIDGQVEDHQVVVSNLPYEEGRHAHPLTEFIFLENNDLLINAGSKTDDCRQELETGVCHEAQQTGLRQYTYIPESNAWSSTYKMYATGLRNSMAIAQHQSGVILQAENSSDIPDADEPYEEINLIKENGFYGWPYCLNRKYSYINVDDACSMENYHEPYTLMPPHVAPLDMAYYTHDYFPQLHNTLLVSWHGYRPVGNRLVAYQMDDQGLPQLTKKPTFMRNPVAPGDEFTQHMFTPKGGMKNGEEEAQHVEIISKWNKVANLRPKGAPVGILTLSDGSLLIIDDRNQAILRLAKGIPYQDKKAVPELSTVNKKVNTVEFRFSGKVKETLLSHCANCHTELHENPQSILNAQQGWLKLDNNTTRLEQRLKSKSRPMPPSGPLNDALIQLVLEAIKTSPD